MNVNKDTSLYLNTSYFPSKRIVPKTQKYVSISKKKQPDSSRKVEAKLSSFKTNLSGSIDRSGLVLETKLSAKSFSQLTDLTDEKLMVYALKMFHQIILIFQII